MSEQNRTADALKMAIQMEVDGKSFYLDASEKSANQLGKALLHELADEEDIHRQKFEEIYQSIQGKKGWPAVSLRPDGGRKLRTIFARQTQKTASGPAPATELGSVEMAMDMENRTYDFYTNQARSAGFNAEREYYETLAAEEKEHHLVLLDYYEYLKNPAGWFTRKERPSLDGG